MLNQADEETTRTDNQKGFRGYITSFVVFFLALDGMLHGLEVISAFYEEAWLTFALTLFHTTIFLLAAYFVGHDHTHHKHEETVD